MENELQIFKYGLKEVRTIIKDGEPWFVAKDVCDILEIKNSRQAVSRLDDDEKNTVTLNDGIGNPNKTIVNEAGLYTLILSSRKPEAKQFKRWITHEVIPAIRKYGAYMTPEVIEKTLTNPDFIIQLATQLKQEREARIKAEKTVFLQTPKVEAFESLLETKGAHSLTSIAKIFGINRNKMIKFLRDKGVLLKLPRNYPAQKYLEEGYFIVRYIDISFNRSKPQTLVTPKGAEFIRQLLKEEKIIA